MWKENSCGLLKAHLLYIFNIYNTVKVVQFQCIFYFRKIYNYLFLYNKWLFYISCQVQDVYNIVGKKNNYDMLIPQIPLN
jgi:hypothetical protein